MPSRSGALRIAQEISGIPLATIHLAALVVSGASTSVGAPGSGLLMCPAWLPRLVKRAIYRSAHKKIIDPILAGLEPMRSARIGLPRASSGGYCMIGGSRHNAGDWPFPGLVRRPAAGLAAADTAHRISPLRRLRGDRSGSARSGGVSGRRRCTYYRHARQRYETRRGPLSRRSVMSRRFCRLGRRAALLTRYPEQLPRDLPAWCAAF